MARSTNPPAKANTLITTLHFRPTHPNPVLDKDDHYFSLSKFVIISAPPLQPVGRRGHRPLVSSSVAELVSKRGREVVEDGGATGA